MCGIPLARGPPPRSRPPCLQVLEDTKGRIEKRQAQTYEELVAEQAEAEEVRLQCGCSCTGGVTGSRRRRRRCGGPRKRSCCGLARWRRQREPSCPPGAGLFTARGPPPDRSRPLPRRPANPPACSSPQEAAAAEEGGSDSEDEFVYNPLKLPLGWDGKPIPYWLYKLHGLNLEFKCEICGEPQPTCWRLSPPSRMRALRAGAPCARVAWRAQGAAAGAWSAPHILAP